MYIPSISRQPKATKQWKRTTCKGTTTKEWGNSQPNGINLTSLWWTLRSIAILKNYKRPWWKTQNKRKGILRKNWIPGGRKSRVPINGWIDGIKK